MSTKNPYLDRWNTPEGSDLQWEALLWVANGGDLPAGFGLTDDGRLDLRGLWVPEPVELAKIVRPGSSFDVTLTSGRMMIEGRRWEDIDFSYSYMPDLWVTDSAFTNCLFDDAVFRGSRIWDTDATDCSIQRADLREVAIGTSTVPTHETRWRNIDFTKAVLRGALFSGCRMDNVTFENAQLNKASFQQCGMSRVTFAGKMREVEFDFRPLKDVPAPGKLVDSNFTRAVMWDVRIIGVYLENTHFPDDVRIVHNYPLVGLGAIEWIMDNDPVGSKSFIDYQFSGLVRSNAWPIDCSEVFSTAEINDGEDDYYERLERALQGGEAIVAERGFDAMAKAWDEAVRAVAS